MPRTRNRQLARIAAAITAALAAAVALPGAAAASYQVRACDDASGGANRSWTVQRTSPEVYLTAFTKCYTLTPDPYGDMQQGIGIFDTIDTDGGALVPSDGRYAEQRFTAPSGTRITAAEIGRDIGNRSQFWTNYGRIDGVDQPSETCYAASGEAFCRLQGIRTFSGLNAQTVAYGARCLNSDGGCTNGSTLHRVWALVRSATITLDDTQAPTVSTPTATGLADGAWHRGAGTITFTADDNTGIRVRRLIEGSTTRTTATAPNAGAGGCGTLNAGDAYTYLQPCASTRGLNGAQAVAVSDVCAWGDGEHTIRAAAEDTGGTSTQSPGTVTVRVDCTAPAVTAAPTEDRTVPAGTAIEPEITASDLRGVASTQVEYQVGLYGSWQPYTGPVTAYAGSAYRFRARATDTVGNTSAWSAASAWTTGVYVEQPSDAEPAPSTAQATTTTTSDTQSTAGPSTLTTVAPAPITSGPVDSTPQSGTAVSRRSLKLTRTRFSRKTRKLTVTGRATGIKTGTVRLTLTVRVRGSRKAKTIKAKARLRAGKFNATIRLPRKTTGRIKVAATLAVGSRRVASTPRSVG